MQNTKVESVPLMNQYYPGDAEEHLDFSDQDLDLVREPLEGVLKNLRHQPRAISRWQFYRTMLFLSVLCFVLGSSLSYFMFSFFGDSSISTSQPSVPLRLNLQQDFINSFAEKSLEKYFQDLVHQPKLGGMPGDYSSASYIQKVWEAQGLEDVELVPYKVLLSYPDKSSPNKVSIITEDSITFVSEAEDENSTIPYLAYSPGEFPSPVVAEPVYVNYGRLEDFEMLKKLQVDVRGKIAIMRLGDIFRGSKIALAAKYGAVGAILYPDPREFTSGAKPYPDSVDLPAKAAQRGTILLHNGDPLTPIYPSTDDAYRIAVRDANLPSIPAHTISYNDARQIMSKMGGMQAPSDWVGDLGIPYRVGPGFLQINGKLHLEVSVERKLKVTYNVIGKITGDKEPDRYVLIGNHRDAWTDGAFDPVSGTAALLEVSQVFRHLVKDEGWRPRRTLVFCSWGSEEFGLIGSQEWVEEKRTQLMHNSVAYLNVDMSIIGNETLEVAAVPLLYNAIWEAAKQVPNPDIVKMQAGEKTVFDTWLKSMSSTRDTNNPTVVDVSSDSDYAPFFHELGVPVADFRYTCSKKPFTSCLPIYHTEYENAVAMKLVDKDFKFHKAVAQVMGLVALNLSDSLIIPFSPNQYAVVLNQTIEDFEKKHGSHLGNMKLLNRTKKAVDDFVTAASSFEKTLRNVHPNEKNTIRQLNNQMLILERAFIDSPGILAGQIFRNESLYLSKHVVFGVSSNDVNSGSRLTALVDAIHSSPHLVQPLVASLIYHIKSATSVLLDSFWQI